MKSTNDSFISSTFWTERIGSVAALKTLEVMEKTKSWEILPKIGESVSEGWQRIGLKYGFNFTIFGINSMSKFKLDDKNNQIFKTFLAQEMLKEGYLAGTQFNASISHSPPIIEAYLKVLDSVIGKYHEVIKEDGGLSSLLDGPIATSEFKRLN
jgi:glutamate-1-semialdehyde aminotransferase